MAGLNKLVSIDDGFISLYEVGHGDRVIVLLSGGLTASPMLDFKQLYCNLAKDFKIIVVEKFGYGFSDDTDKSRNVDIILEETRAALKIEDIKPPFILAPHSMSGIEALYWYQKYPDEVTAIIGLDMATYEAYDILNVNMFGLKLNRLLIKMGLAYLFPKAIESDAVKNGSLSQEEKQTYQKLFRKNFTSKATLNEVKQIKENSLAVKNCNLTNLPILVLTSNGQGTGIEKSKWLCIQQKLKKKSRYGKIIFFDCPHFIHNHRAKEIAIEIKSFLREVKDDNRFILPIKNQTIT